MPAPGINSTVSPAPTPRHGVGPALLWACFLGCSWTWVIGMFLPIMLLRDFGVAGWVAFAVPNVVGAAAMGFVLKSPAVSWNLTQQHAGALRWFAGVTIAYQIYVVVWLFNFQWLWLALACVLPWLVMGRDQRERSGAWLPTLSVAVAVVSWGAFSYANQLDGAWIDVGFAADADVHPSRLTPLDLWILTPGLICGFLLCPYLDPTFHRARYSTGPRTGRAAFALGFGVVFGSMIVFTLLYAGLTRPLVDGETNFQLASPWKALLTIHVGAQVAFTLLAHGRERFDDAARDAAKWGSIVTRGLVLVGFAGLLGLAAAGRFDFVQNFIPGLTPGEVGYRLFLLAYGVFFPGYVLICMIPTFRHRPRPRNSGTQPLTSGGANPGGTDSKAADSGGVDSEGAAKRRVFLIACLIAYPLAVMGLIVGPSWWLLGLYATLALGRLAVECLPAQPQKN